MKVTLWGTRGSLASPGPETARYGGNTSCVQVEGGEGTILVLDAGTGIRRLGMALPKDLKRVDLLLTHLHMDHIQGLAFFPPLRTSGAEMHIWGPASATLSLRERLTRYLSPPLFPVFLREMPSRLHLHEVPGAAFEIGEFRVSSTLVCHPDPTVGYRIAGAEGVVSYIPDHEPALGAREFPMGKEWTSGIELAEGADLLIHDAQYAQEEYADRVGFGHSTLLQAFQFAELAEVERLVPFHHDPSHTDDDLDRMMTRTLEVMGPSFSITPGVEGAVVELGD